MPLLSYRFGGNYSLVVVLIVRINFLSAVYLVHSCLIVMDSIIIVVSQTWNCMLKIYTNSAEKFTHDCELIV